MSSPASREEQNNAPEEKKTTDAIRLTKTIECPGNQEGRFSSLRVGQVRQIDWRCFRPEEHRPQHTTPALFVVRRRRCFPARLRIIPLSLVTAFLAAR